MRMLRQACKDNGLLGKGVLKDMKRFLPILLTICMCFGLSGCVENKDIAGKEQVEALREAAKEYRSGRYLIMNAETNILEQVFSFMYNEDGTQTFLYEIEQNGAYYAEYSDGKSFYRGSPESFEILDESSPEYQAYTEKEPHPYSDAQLLFYINNYISSSETGSDDNGNTLYYYTYDTEKISEALGVEVTEFATSYAFDANGGFIYFRQYNVADGVIANYDISIVEENALTEIANPFVSE